MSQLSNEDIVRVLRATHRSASDSLSWWVGSYIQVDGKWITDPEDNSLHIAADCSDVFHWATADSEEITPENIEMFIECMELFHPKFSFHRFAWLDGALFAARVRNILPQEPILRDLREGGYTDMLELFQEAAR